MGNKHYESDKNTISKTEDNNIDKDKSLSYTFYKENLNYMRQSYNKLPEEKNKFSNAKKCEKGQKS